VSWVRLRQVALVVHDLDAVVDELHRSFGLEVAHRDPAVAEFGLRNAVLPVGDQFVEVVSPTRDGTAGGRQLARLGGDGGYMVICHTDAHDEIRANVQALGVRAVVDADDHGYRIYQLHPSDTGGSFLEIDHQPGGEDPSGPWMPAGPDWHRARRTDMVSAIAGVTVQCVDPDAVATRGGAITGVAPGGRSLELESGTVRFVPGPLDALAGVTLTATDRARAGEVRTIGGVRFELV
jgi:hypothetical protein